MIEFPALCVAAALVWVCIRWQFTEQETALLPFAARRALDQFPSCPQPVYPFLRRRRQSLPQSPASSPLHLPPRCRTSFRDNAGLVQQAPFLLLAATRLYAQTTPDIARLSACAQPRFGSFLMTLQRLFGDRPFESL